jgi:glycosyltransferase involved in cell wall biosynthesis
MDIAFVSTYNARDVSQWSGLGYYISNSLENSGNKLEYIGDVTARPTLQNFVKKAYYSKVKHKKFFYERTVAMAKEYSDNVAARLAGSKSKYVFSPGSIPIAFLKTDRPKIFFTDATFASWLDYYEPSSNLSHDIIRQGHEIEKQALDSCALAIYSSEWAAQSAIQFYGTDPAKVKISPFGANFKDDFSKADVLQFISGRDQHKLKILFNGVNFIRKGGDIVMAAVQILREKGLDVELHFVGLPALPFKNIPDFVINHGYLKKAVPAEKALLESLYQTCHFLFLPSKAEAFGCVFCEASAFGMPSISRKTGGIMSAIIDGVNGFTLDNTASADEYATLIYSYFIDKEKYHQLALSSYNEYNDRLNWKSIGAALTGMIEQL